MAFDRHRIWREVAHISKHLLENPRAGHESLVELFIAGRAAPVVVLVAETHRNIDYPWVKLYTGEDEGGYVFVHEALVERIEVSYRPAEGEPRPPVGFRADEITDENPSSAS